MSSIDDDPDQDDLETQEDPPSPDRVAARALVLAAVACRGFVEEDAAEAGDFWARTRAWLGSLGIDSELEERERWILDAPLGSLSERDRIDATWLAEGVLVLAWALGCAAMPAYDDQVPASDVAESLGFLQPREETVLAAPALRSRAEIDEYREGMFAVHWRLRDFSNKPKALDFAELAKTAWFGPLSLSRARLVEGDLAIDDVPIHRADPDDVDTCTSIAEERHRAANWLAGWGDPFSGVDTST